MDPIEQLQTEINKAERKKGIEACNEIVKNMMGAGYSLDEILLLADGICKSSGNSALCGLYKLWIKQAYNKMAQTNL